MAFDGRFEETVYVRFDATVDTDMGWVSPNYFPFNGVLADWFINKEAVGTEVDQDGVPIP